MYLSNRMLGLGLLALVCLVAFAFGLSGCAVADREVELTAEPGDICPNGIEFTTWCGCLPPLVGDDC